MKVFYSTEDAAGKLNNAVVTTGSFDGVHLGHKVIINRLNQIAREIDGESVLITFHPHPRKVLYPEQTDLKLINSQEEKIELLKKAGLQNLIIIPFSIEFSKTSSHDFINDILIDQLKAKVIVVGHNHHFGHNRQGDYAYLHQLAEKLGFTVEEIPLQDIENETVSSTKIRKALFQGNIQRANAYLDHQYIISGLIADSNGVTSIPNVSFFSIIIEEDEKLVPPPGIYASNLFLENKWLKSVSLIVNNQNGEPQILTHLIYDKVNPFGQMGTLYFYKKVMSVNSNSNAWLSDGEFEQALELVEDLIY